MNCPRRLCGFMGSRSEEAPLKPDLLAQSEVPSRRLTILNGVQSEHNQGGAWRESEFLNSAGLRIHAYDVPPHGACRGIAILVHGIRGHALFENNLSEHPGGRRIVFTGSLADKLSHAGFHVFTYDQQGHGLSDGFCGKRCHVNRFDDLARDLLLFVKLARAEHAANDLPVFGVGSSMGGGVLFRGAQLDPPAFTGLAFLAPMLSIERLASKPANRLLLPIGSFLSQALPGARLLYMPPAPNAIFVAECDADPLNFQGRYMRTRVSMEMMLACRAAVRSCADIRTPFITFHSDNDTLVDPESSAILLRDAQTEDKEYIQVNSMWHALLHEDGAQDVMAKIIQWITTRTDMGNK